MVNRDSISRAFAKDPKLRFPGVILCSNQYLVLKRTGIAIEPRYSYIIFSEDDLRRLELALVYMKKLTR
jgi:hypothetical protein